MPTPLSDSGGQMFRWFLKPKFYSKCYTYVKFIRTRLESIQKKRNAVQKIMKSDIAELLRSGLDYDAYKRAEGLLLEQKMSSCYEFIGHYIGCISDHLQDLTKQSDCPDECKEAVPSLMYAAARFGDLPELRDLRTLFTEKFGNSLEPYTSKELVEKLRRDPPAREVKIRLLLDIAQELSIEWDGKALEQRLSRQPSLYEERPNLDKTDNLVTGETHTDGRDFDASKGKERDTPSQGRKDFNDESWRHQSSSDDDETSTDMSSVHGRKASSSSLGSISEDEIEIKKPSSYWLVPPPYLKQRTNKGGSNSKKTTDSEAPLNKEPNHDLDVPDVQEKPIPRSSRRRHLKSKPTQHDTVSDSKTYDAAKLDSGGNKSGKGKAFDSQQGEYDTGQNRRRTRSYVRGTSLPPEPTTSLETSKGHARSISSGSEMKGGAGRVHPNLPDYDDLAARLRALRGR